MKRLPVIEEAEPLPLLHGRWLADLLSGPIPRETDATCGTCAMCKSGDGYREQGDVVFNPQAKCCTYLPVLPNYLAGGILRDRSPDGVVGRRTLMKRIGASVAVTPLGVDRPRSYRLLYDAGAASLFGRAEALVCPHFLVDSGGCSIWHHRNSVCTTYFCKHVRGQVGRSFWSDAAVLLDTIEEGLAIWCALEVGIDGDALRRVLPKRRKRESAATELEAEFLEVATRRRHTDLWGEWTDREGEFFEACAEKAEPLSWKRVLEICGSDARAASVVLLDAYRKLTSFEIPERVVANPRTIRPAPDPFVQISTYHQFEPLLARKELVSILDRFDGRTTVRALQDELESEAGLILEPELLRKLLDFGILRPIGNDEARPTGEAAQRHCLQPTGRAEHTEVTS